jgi:DNA (cytosine-5)-methyltransferase 1
VNKPTCVDAFCGAGGLSLGLVAAGFNVLLGFDLDPVCMSTLKANPRRVRHPVLTADVRSMLGGKLLEIIGMKSGQLDLLAGGPPCQGFSVQRIGDDTDDRNLLVNDYADLILEVRPRLFLMENVAGLGGKRGQAILQRFVNRIGTEGYIIHQRTVDAQEYGVPQRRRRLIIVGERCEIPFSRFHWPSRLEGSPPTVRDTIGHLPPPPPNGVDHPDLPGHRADRLSRMNRLRLEALQEGQGRTHLPDSLLAACHRVSADVVGHRNVYGRMAWDEVAPTITARFDSFTRGKFGHPEQVRTISLLEGALLQTFPRDYRFVGSKVEVARQIGNAVPPRLAAALGRAVRSALKAWDSETQS